MNYLIAVLKDVRKKEMNRRKAEMKKDRKKERKKDRHRLTDRPTDRQRLTLTELQRKKQSQRENEDRRLRTQS